MLEAELAPGPPTNMLIDYAAITHQGCVRKNNEDAYLVSALDGEEPVINGLPRTLRVCPRGFLTAVADGMGGAAAGEIASREGLTHLALYLFGHWGRLSDDETQEETLVNVLFAAAEEASRAVIRYSDEDRTARGMGSTLTSTLLWNGAIYWVQVGDSRAYLFRNPGLVQLTRDQTLMNDLISSGQLTPEEARTHPQRSMITQALGCPHPIKAAIGKVMVRRGDRLLLCSDGLHGELGDEQIQDILGRGYSTRRALEALLEQALEHGARDNVTAILVSMDDLGFPLPMPGEPVQLHELHAGPTSMEEEFGMVASLGRFFRRKP